MSLCQRLADFFAAHPHEWIDAHRLLALGGTFAFRTRISDLRKPRYGSMTIENRWRDAKGLGGTTYRISEYRYVPAAVGREGRAETPSVDACMASPSRLF